MTDVRDPLPLDGQLCFALYGASLAMTRAYKPLLDELGITYPQYLVLHALWEEDGRSVGVIAKRLALDSSTITPLVKRLDAVGLVSRTRDPADERQVRVTLTGAGRALQGRCGCLGERILARSGMTPAQVNELTDQVQALRRALVAGTEAALRIGPSDGWASGMHGEHRRPPPANR